MVTRDTAGLCGCGGIAYIGSFDDTVDEPVFVFNTSLTGVIEAVSHEVGHAMLLSHDGLSGGSVYYGGHGSNEASWGPIMGAAYNRKVTQWSAGEYHDANNTGTDANYGRGPDDLVILSSLTNGNGFGYVLDDHGDDDATGSVVASGTHKGTISTINDLDVFVVTTTGGLSIEVAPHPDNHNLDTYLMISTLGGAVVAVSDDTSTLAASVDLPDLAAGTYLITVGGDSWGSPLASPPKRVDRLRQPWQLYHGCGRRRGSRATTCLISM